MNFNVTRHLKIIKKHVHVIFGIKVSIEYSLHAYLDPVWQLGTQEKFFKAGKCHDFSLQGSSIFMT